MNQAFELAAADAAATSRATVALRTLQDCGLLKVEPRGITVLDLEGLRSFAGVGN
jgi:hypothetical protein